MGFSLFYLSLFSLRICNNELILCSILKIQGGGQEPESGQCSQPINISSSDGVAELENLLKQKTFSR